MIKEVMEEKIGENIDGFLEVISDYFGEKNYKDIIYNKANNIHVSVIRNSGIVDLNDEQIYVDAEPVCVKQENNSYIFIPVTLMKEETGNIVFVHELLHAVLENDFYRDNDLFNEVLIDYMANEIGGLLKEKNVNFTFCDEPKYYSESFYSKFFPLIEKFYKNNKDLIIDAYVNNKKVLEDEANEVIKLLEDNFYEVLEKENNIVNKTIKK